MCVCVCVYVYLCVFTMLAALHGVIFAPRLRLASRYSCSKCYFSASVLAVIAAFKCHLGGT